jgi:hypothetical protein
MLHGEDFNARRRVLSIYTALQEQSNATQPGSV